MDHYESVWLEEHVTKGLLVHSVSTDFICFGTGCVLLFSITRPVFASLK